MVTHKTIAYNRHFYFPVCSIIRKRKGAYDKNSGITHDTAVFALALKICQKSEAVPNWNRVRIIIISCG